MKNIMLISELIKELEKFKTKHGDILIEMEYWCEDCNDTHTGHKIELELISGEVLKLSAQHIGMD